MARQSGADGGHHLFVPEHRAEEALRLLQDFSGRGTG